MAFAFPCWIDNFLVADDVFAQAYDACSPEQRAVFKTAIARTAAVCGVGDARVFQSQSRMRQGFSCHSLSHPAPWVVLVWDGAYASPARVLAALVPAMLAGVPNILACRVVRDGTPFPQSILAALELAGQERVMECRPEDVQTLVAACCGTDARGRLILLGRDDVFGDVSSLAAEMGTLTLRYGAAVRIGLALPSSAEPLSEASLRFAHPDAAFEPFTENATGRFSAVFCAPAAVQENLNAAPLVLSPGEEGYWAWNGLSLGFFMETAQGIASGEADISAL